MVLVVCKGCGWSKFVEVNVMTCPRDGGELHLIPRMAGERDDFRWELNVTLDRVFKEAYGA